MKIWYYDNKQLVEEKIVAGNIMRLIYENPTGRATLPFLVKRKIFSHLYGAYCRTGHSAKKISTFIKDYNIDMTGCTGSYKNFAEFFSREKSGVLFPENTEESIPIGSPCEGLICVDDNIDPGNLIAAKGSYFPLNQLLGDSKLAESYRDGIMLKIRLTPTNYHRMHFFDDAKIEDIKFIDGHLYSVSPIALPHIANLYCQNKRAVVQLATKNFGDAIIVEVGATFVGSIVHLFKEGDYVKCGQQASYFLPGGSLVMIFFKKGAFVPDKALVSNTKEGFETKINIGIKVGAK